MHVKEGISSFVVIPGLTRNPVFSWIPAFAGMTDIDVISDPAHITHEAMDL
jgi:hypothetical protein